MQLNGDIRMRLMVTEKTLESNSRNFLKILSF